MTLNDLIRSAMHTGQQLTSGDIPLLIDGKEVEEIKFRIHFGGDSKLHVSMEIKK